MIRPIYNYLKEKDEDVAVGLAAGLVFGLAAGLAAGLATGLATGLAGLVAGLVAGLATGLAAGLVAGLAAGLVSGLVNLSSLIALTPLNIILLIIVILGLGEILYWTIEKPKKTKEWLKETLIAKADNIFSSALIIINLLNLVWIIRNVTIKPEWILYGIATIIITAIIIGIIYLWLWINGKKFRR